MREGIPVMHSKDAEKILTNHGNHFTIFTIMRRGCMMVKNTGIVRRVDDLGRIVIPKKTRTTLGIETKDPLEIFVSNDAIMLRKYAPSCVFCGENDGLIEYKGKKICRKCREEIRNR